MIRRTLLATVPALVAVKASALLFGGASVAAGTTLNPSDKLNVNLSGGNLTWAGANSTAGGVRSVGSTSAGKIYFEYVFTNIASLTQVGLADATGSFSSPGVGTARMTSGGFFEDPFSPDTDTQFYNDFVNGDVLQVAANIATHGLWFQVNGSGVWTFGGDPAAGTSPITIGSVSTPTFAFVQQAGNASNSGTFRFASASWGFAAPSGFGVLQ